MKEMLTNNALAILLIVAAATCAIAGVSGWGWFLFVSLFAIRN